MKEILAIFVANKAVNAMTDTTERNVWFRFFRACFWLSMAGVTVCGFAWAVAFVLSAIRAIP